MTNLTTYNETRQPREAILGYVFNGLAASDTQNTRVEIAKAEGENFEAWIATLLKLVADQEREAPVARTAGTDSSPRENKPPLEKLAAGPYRSLGGYFDYGTWADRDRFLELDQLIASGQETREAEVERDFEMV